MAVDAEHHAHLWMRDRSIQQTYVKRSKIPIGGLKLVSVDRAAHGAKLYKTLSEILPVADERQRESEARKIATSPGILLEFESFPGHELAISSLDSTKGDIQLLNVRYADTKMYATCFVPDGKLTTLIRKIKAYIEQQTIFNRPRNDLLARSIQSIGLAAVEALWTDSRHMPAADEQAWWEIWLRSDGLGSAAVYNRFHFAADQFGIHLARQRLEFPERVVIHARCTKAQLSDSYILLNMIAELRRADEPLSVPPYLSCQVQDDIVDSLENQITANNDVAIAILDTGVARGHPLLSPALAAEDLHSVEPGWGTADHDGHGTKMAGLALYGCLHEAAGRVDAEQIAHKLESVKIIPPANTAGGGDEDHDVLGNVVAQAVLRCEIAAPERRRVFCKAVTTASHETGEPTAYSSAIDQLAYGEGADGVNDQERRLFAISSGNVQPDTAWLTYPQSNDRYKIEQPAQAWNALTVGAYTDKITLPATQDFAGWQTLALSNDLSPFSSTSTGWDRSWPIKPDVLFEGGNVAVDPGIRVTEQPPTLQMLTTNRAATARPTATFNMTSAATALASRLAARIMVAYPDAWPETVRGLIVQHASWSNAQKVRYLTAQTQDAKLQLLRSCGYGIVNEERALNSVRNGVTMMIQESLQPFRMKDYQGAMNQMQLFELPWPREQLLALGEATVRLKITLSYFVEPSPGSRGWASKYQYGSHGLRFALRRLNESAKDFNRRVNHSLLAVDENAPESPLDNGWDLGVKLQTFGSVHSDTWTGTAAELVSKNLLAVYPIIGWWRQRHNLGKVTNRARFSLLISLEAPEADIDLFGLLEQQIALPTKELEYLRAGELVLDQ